MKLETPPPPTLPSLSPSPVALPRALPRYVLRAGLVARHGRIKSAGAVWGEDFVLAAAHPECIDASAAMALTYVHVTRLSGEQLEVRATLSLVPLLLPLPRILRSP